MIKKLSNSKNALKPISSPLADWKALAGLDVKDRKLLGYLSQNYRLPHTYLAKQIGLSKDAVKYRIQKLESRGLILNKMLLTNPVWIGHEYIMVFFNFQNLTLEKEKKLFEFFTNHTATNTVYRLAGKWQICWGVDARDLVEFDEFLNESKIFCGDNLNECEILPVSKEYLWTNLINAVVTDLTLSPIKYSQNDSTFERDILNEPPVELRHGEGISLTAEELNIMNAFNENIHITLDEIAQKVHLAKDTVGKIFRNLIHIGAVNTFWPFFNYKKFGLESYFIFIRLKYLNEQWDQKLNLFIRNHLWIRWGVKVIGNWDLLFEIPCKNHEHFYSILTEFRNEFNEILQSYDSISIADYVYLDVTKPLIANERRPKHSWLQPKT